MVRNEGISSVALSISSVALSVIESVRNAISTGEHGCPRRRICKSEQWIFSSPESCCMNSMARHKGKGNQNENNSVGSDPCGSYPPKVTYKLNLLI